MKKTEVTLQRLEQLLGKEEIQAALQLRPSPSYPATWKAGFMDRMLGKDKPWGDWKEARTLLTMGKTGEGRELLRRLCIHQPQDKDTLALGAFECLRGREDRTVFSSRFRTILRLYPDSHERYALETIGTFTTNSKVAYFAYLRNHQAVPDNPLATFLCEVQDICVSDINHQVLFGEVGHDITSSIIIPVFKGAALFLIRRHDEALSIFLQGYREADKVADTYQQRLGFKFTQEQREVSSGMMKILSITGLRVTLFDLGLDDLAKRVEELHAPEKRVLRGIIDSHMRAQLESASK